MINSHILEADAQVLAEDIISDAFEAGGYTIELERELMGETAYRELVEMSANTIQGAAEASEEGRFEEWMRERLNG